MKRILDLTKSKSDKRVYLFKQLPNKLGVLLISDMEADKSAAALNVNIGSLLDFKEYPGLAHFLEHMLFMGTSKYPKENEYSEYLNQNSGWSNAFTDLDATNYYFEVSNDGFPGAIDRFAQFFISPLFAESAVSREVNAVDSENKKNLQSDLWRFMQLQRSEANVDSIFHNFSTGNNETLNKPDIRKSLIDFHETFYSSHLMNLVMISNRTIEELENITDSLFLDIPIKDETFRPKYDDVPAYNKDNLGFFYHYVPVREMDTLSFYWFLDNAGQHYATKPLNFLTSALGHEGPNTLCSSLKKDNLITSLTAGYDHVANTFSKFYISIALSKKGLKEWRKVAERVLYMIKKIQGQAVNKRYFEEFQKITQLKFDFKGKEDPSSYCCDLAYNLKNYAPEDILEGPYVVKNYNEELLRKYIDSLNVDNLNVYFCSKQFENICDKTEEWYGTKYTKQKFDNDFLKMADCDPSKPVCEHNLDYPPLNEFIPSELELYPNVDKERDFPERVFKGDDVEVWYKRDYTFKLPKAYAILQIYLDKSFLSQTEYELISGVWHSIVEQELNEIMYMAEEANLRMKVYFNYDGLQIQADGFHSSILNALVLLFKRLKEITTKDKEEILKTQIEKHVKNLKNFALSVPYSQNLSYLEYLLMEPSTTAAKKLALLENNYLDIDRLNFFVTNYLNKTRYEWLFQGNLHEDEIVQLAQDCQRAFSINPLEASETMSYRIAQIPKKHNYVYVHHSIHHEELNSSLVSYFQCGKLSLEEQCCLALVESLLNERFFDEIRTKQALGYITRLFRREYRNIEGIACLVQSTVKSPEAVWQSVTNFFDAAFTFLNNELSDETFKAHVNSVIIEKKAKDLVLADEVFRNLSEIKKREGLFNRKQIHIEILERISKEKVVEFFNEHFVNNVKRLDVEVLGKHHLEENELSEVENGKICAERGIKRVKVNTIEEFKRKVGLHADYYSLI